MTTWKKQLEANSDLNNIHSWGAVSISALPKAKRDGFRRNLRTITLYLKLRSVDETATIQGISPRRVYDLLHQSLACNDYSEPALLQALIPYKRLKGTIRHKPLSSATDDCGDAGSLQYVFTQHPDILETLRQLLTKDLKDKATGLNTTIQLIHSTFLELLKQKDWDPLQWPFHRESLGYGSIKNWYHKTRKKLTHIPKREKITVREPVNKYVYRELQFDEYTVDLMSSVYFQFGLEQLGYRVSRCALLVLMDVDSELIIAYKLIFNKSVVKEDVRDLLLAIKNPMRPPQVSRNGIIKVNPAGVISGALKERLMNIQLGEVHCDNAYVHLAHSVSHFISNRLGGTLHLGRPALPLPRRAIEFIFNLLNIRYVHLPKSTTGSHPMDPIKESAKNYKNAPIVSTDDLCDQVDSFIADHNASPKANLRGLTPIERAEWLLDNVWHPYDTHHLSEWELKGFHKDHNISVKMDPRSSSVWINHFGLKYTAQTRNISIDSIINGAYLYYDPHDIRILYVYSPSQEYIGDFWAPKSWQDYPFTNAQRRYIQGQVRRSVFSKKHPLVDFALSLLHGLDKPSNALRLNEIFKNISPDNKAKIQFALEKQSQKTKSSKPNTILVPRDRAQGSSEIKFSVKEVIRHDIN